MNNSGYSSFLLFCFGLYLNWFEGALKCFEMSQIFTGSSPIIILIEIHHAAAFKTRITTSWTNKILWLDTFYEEQD